MCDTLVALPAATADGSLLLAKNSDREPNEAQVITCAPAVDYPEGIGLRCTYLQIPQARHTHAVLISRPFWMWGAEMGVNEHGVVIGNEALFTKVKVPATGLTGMDLLRLGLDALLRLTRPYRSLPGCWPSMARAARVAINTSFTIRTASS